MYSMSSFGKQVDKLENIVLEKENYSKGKALSAKIIRKYPVTDQLDAIESFLSSVSMCIDLPEEIAIHRDITQWLVSNYKLSKSCIFADLILSWLNQKLEFDDPGEVSEEARLSLSLFNDILENNPPNKEVSALTNDFQGHATYALLIGIADNNKELIQRAIDSQRQVLRLYQSGKFPDYYNVPVFIAGAKMSLGSCLMDIVAHDGKAYSEYYDESGSLLHEAAEEFESIGTDFDKSYSKELLKKYGSLSI